jgi:hypothetical protein
MSLSGSIEYKVIIIYNDIFSTIENEYPLIHGIILLQNSAHSTRAMEDTINS